ncbi:CAP domain-containing protein [Sphingomonas lycopersici]|uniref:CAP domain-containing protein n=1 Tax=Sphingomonas lycopersici TaxID=2951807 RepID=A0AA41Z728_9SPHN|nr:CAP domain-containing protein [Sphingomonas lycopersici]MCW6535200.1 CAP domain-containing protein [Sphingomonas lycopersici]
MNCRIRRTCLVALPLLVAGCGDSGGGGGLSVSQPAATPSPSPSPSSSPTSSSTPGSWAQQAAALYDVQPNVSTCSSGTLKASVKANFLSNLNTLRALHNLPPVVYSNDEDSQEQDSSLMMAVARQLSHSPSSTWQCYSASGAGGAGASNLVGVWGSNTAFDSDDDYLALWMTENGAADIGHRRWILDPFLGKTSYGRVSIVLADGSRASAASMRVLNFNAAPAVPSGVPAFVAYPYGDYPQRYFGASDYLSFTAIASTLGVWANQSVSFASATVTVTGPSGAMPVTDVSTDNLGYGVPNSIQWRVTGLQPAVSYSVTINNVSGAPKTSYSYTFRMVP